jgi:hypothetical protein
MHIPQTMNFHTLRVTVTKRERQSQYDVPVINRFTGGPSELRQNEAPTINKDSTSPGHLQALFSGNYSPVGGIDEHTTSNTFTH